MFMPGCMEKDDVKMIKENVSWLMFYYVSKCKSGLELLSLCECVSHLVPLCRVSARIPQLFSFLIEI